VIRRSLPYALALLAALFLAAPASASWFTDAQAIRKGLTAAVKDERLTKAEAARYRREVRRTRVALRRMSWTSAVNLGAVLHDVARQSRALSRARSLVLFSELRTNRRWLRSHPMPAAKVDIFDSHGVLYRSFPGQGLRFHPLGNFARLNGLVARGRLPRARRLARALTARGVRRAPGTTVWQYTFPFGWGSPPWTSGMAQAVAAQTLAWAAEELARPRLTAHARRAYRAVPGRLTLRLSAGPWVRLYSFSGLVVLNAQLQTALSIGGYAERTGHRRAARFAARLRASSAKLLPSFDTGYWTYYSPGNESSLSYHVYVVQLLRKLAKRTGAPIWRRTAQRFNRYTHEPPKLRGRPSRRLLYPWPVDGFKDLTTISFWLSKPSRVRLRLPGLSHTISGGKGRYHVLWKPAGVAPGLYRPRLKAVDLAGNRAKVKLEPIEVAVDREAPEVTARIYGRRLVWRAEDRATPWIRLKLRLVRGERRRAIPLGIRPLNGSTRIPRLRARWDARLAVSDSSGNRRHLRLGLIGG
jgi:hypothetical protein